MAECATSQRCPASARPGGLSWRLAHIKRRLSRRDIEPKRQLISRIQFEPVDPVRRPGGIGVAHRCRMLVLVGEAPTVRIMVLKPAG